MSLFMLKLAQYLILNNHIFSIPLQLGEHLVRIADVTVKFQYRESENRKIRLIRSIRRLIIFDPFLVILDRYKKSSSDFTACIKICAGINGISGINYRSTPDFMPFLPLLPHHFLLTYLCIVLYTVYIIQID